MTLEHDHLLDGVLHDGAGCPMCVEIRRRIERGKADAAAARALSAYGDIARREANAGEP
jgi:hydrogenase maturation factor